MKREIITTGDGSKTIHIPEWDEQYHSKHGAIQEARHVFMETGLAHYIKDHPETKEISILEMGFGTGLNALLTYYKGRDLGLHIDYVGIDAFPISHEEVDAMDYSSQIAESGDSLSIYNAMHSAPWESKVEITGEFSLTKHKKRFEEMEGFEGFNLVFFDAFGPRVHPDAWTENIFKKMYDTLEPSGILTTYCAQGAARRAMQAAGFQVERLPGPPGKREMLRATK